MNHSDYLAALERLQMLNNPSVDQRVKAIYCHADAVLADKATIYDAEHAPTPLTVELIEAELGKPLYEWCWKVGRNRIMYSKWSGRVDLNGSLVLTTLGHLRQIVSMLRCGEVRSETL